MPVAESSVSSDSLAVKATVVSPGGWKIITLCFKLIEYVLMGLGKRLFYKYLILNMFFLLCQCQGYSFESDLFAMCLLKISLYMYMDTMG